MVIEHLPKRELPIIFITGHGDIPMSVQAMKRGAIEFLTKPFRDQDLLDGVQLGLSCDRARRENEKVLADLKERFASLSPREREIVIQVARGRLDAEYADHTASLADRNTERSVAARPAGNDHNCVVERIARWRFWKRAAVITRHAGAPQHAGMQAADAKR